MRAYSFSPEGSGNGEIVNDVIDKPRVGSGLKNDIVKPIIEVDPKTGKQVTVKEFPGTPKAHGFNDIVDNYVGDATKTPLYKTDPITKTPIHNADLYQIEGAQNGVPGRYEWIVQDGKVTHRMFISGGTMNGAPIKP